MIVVHPFDPSTRMLGEIYKGIEAIVNGVDASAQEIDDDAWNFAIRFGLLLRGGSTLEETAGVLMDSCYMDSDLTVFNYSRLTWRPEGNEPLPPASED